MYLLNFESECKYAYHEQDQHHFGNGFPRHTIFS
jgi:hypothetical protein